MKVDKSKAGFFKLIITYKNNTNEVATIWELTWYLRIHPLILNLFFFCSLKPYRLQWVIEQMAVAITCTYIHCNTAPTIN